MRRTLTLIITDRCNLACKYCYVSKGNADMCYMVARKAIDVALADGPWAPDADGINLDFIGGEPLLRAKFIDMVMDYFHYKLRGHRFENQHGASLTTNGLLYETPEAQALLRHKCLEIGMTIDGPRPVHDANRVTLGGVGSHATVERAARLWLKQFPAVTTSTKVTLGRETIANLCESVLYLLFDLGVPKVNANVVFEGPWTEEDAAVFEAQLLKLGRAMMSVGAPLDRCSLFSRYVGYRMHPDDNGTWCGCGRWMLAASPDGKLYPCNRFAPSGTIAEPIPVGDVFSGVDPTKLEPFAGLCRSAQEPEECRDCEIKGACAWCKGHDHDEGHLWKRSTSLCLMHKARVRANRTLMEEGG
jgi:uncharacterized protein